MEPAAKKQFFSKHATHQEYLLATSISAVVRFQQFALCKLPPPGIGRAPYISRHITSPADRRRAQRSAKKRKDRGCSRSIEDKAASRRLAGCSVLVLAYLRIRCEPNGELLLARDGRRGRHFSSNRDSLCAGRLPSCPVSAAACMRHVTRWTGAYCWVGREKEKLLRYPDHHHVPTSSYRTYIYITCGEQCELVIDPLTVKEVPISKWGTYTVEPKRELYFC
jgi:hypothetical protein